MKAWTTENGSLQGGSDAGLVLSTDVEILGQGQKSSKHGFGALPSS